MSDMFTNQTLILCMPLEPFTDINETHIIISVRQITQGSLDYHTQSEIKISGFQKVWVIKVFKWDDIQGDTI